MNWTVFRDPTLLATAAVFGILAFIALQAGLFGIWLGILMLIALGRYCYVVLRAAAQGRTRIPAVSIDCFNPVGNVAVLGHILLFPGLIIVTATMQPTGALVAAALACIFPASAALMGMTNNLLYALSPSALSEVAKKIGRDYFMLVCICAGIFVGVGLLREFVAPSLPVIGTVGGMVIETWGLLAAFALIGSVIRVHRQAFEIPGEIVPPEELQISQRHKQWRSDLDRAYASIRSGLIDAGYQTLHKLINDNEDSLDINCWIVENLFEWEDKKYAIEVAAKLIPRLLTAHEGAAALKLYQRCRFHDDRFALPTEITRSLAGFAESIGQVSLSDELKALS